MLKRLGWASALALGMLATTAAAAAADNGALAVPCAAWDSTMKGPRRTWLRMVYDHQADSVDLACRPGSTPFYFELTRDDCAAVQGLLRRYWSWQAHPRGDGKPQWLGALDLQGGFMQAGTPQRGGGRSSVVFWGLAPKDGKPCMSLQFESIQSGDSASLATPDSLVLDGVAARRLYWGLDPERLDAAFSHRHKKKVKKDEDAAS